MNNKKIIALIICTLCCVGHYYLSVQLFGTLFAWGDSTEPVTGLAPVILGVILIIMNPLQYVVYGLDILLRVSDIWYYPISFVASSIAWWGAIAFFILRGGRQSSQQDNGLRFFARAKKRVSA